MRRAKIICTLGPSSSDEEKIEALIKAGMNIARLNFSHNTHDFYRVLVNRIRHVAAKLNKPVAILQDLQGPKIRTLTMPEDGLELVTGEEICVTNEELIGSKKCIAVDYKNIVSDVSLGEEILLDDGKIILEVLDKTENYLRCIIKNGGILKSKKGVNFPNSATSLNAITQKDIKDIHFGAQVHVDAVALSFVRTAQDILQLRKELSVTKTKPLIIAKIEKPQAIEELDNIIQVSDGVMVARGDLGVEIPPERVPLLQKKIIDRALVQGKTVAVATEMLESMISQARPTRAESSDVANAVLDGADMLMLSAETAVGSFPVEAVKAMDNIISHVEESDLASYWLDYKNKYVSERDNADVMAFSAVQACNLLNASAIVMFTSTGFIARLVSRYRPNKPIIAFVPDGKVQRTLSFIWGVKAIIMHSPDHTSELIAKINSKLLSLPEFRPSEKIVLLTKIPLLTQKHTNTILIHTLRP